jgi:hypothetical protein
LKPLMISASVIDRKKSAIAEKNVWSADAILLVSHFRQWD